MGRDDGEPGNSTDRGKEQRKRFLAHDGSSSVTAPRLMRLGRARRVGIASRPSDRVAGPRLDETLALRWSGEPLSDKGCGNGAEPMKLAELPGELLLSGKCAAP
jgi:hypothetical protein